MLREVEIRNSSPPLSKTYLPQIISSTLHTASPTTSRHSSGGGGGGGGGGEIGPFVEQ